MNPVIKIDAQTQIKWFVRLANNLFAFQDTRGRVRGTPRGLFTLNHFKNLEARPDLELKNRAKAVQIFGTWIAKFWPDPFRVIRMSTRREKDKIVYEVYDNEILVWEKEVLFSDRTVARHFMQIAKEQEELADKLTLQD